jgi:hypothetical protein
MCGIISIHFYVHEQIELLFKVQISSLDLWCQVTATAFCIALLFIYNPSLLHTSSTSQIYHRLIDLNGNMWLSLKDQIA